jgi:uncharacterized protein
MRGVDRTVSAPEDLGVELIGVPAGAKLRLALQLQSVSEGVLVTGKVTASVEGECSRCLRPISDTVVVTLQELYAYPGSTTAETTDEGEVSRLEGDLLDLEPALRDAVVLALPTNPRCRKDCPGLCPECGARWDDLPKNHSHEAVDPRWAALGKLKAPKE